LGIIVGLRSMYLITWKFSLPTSYIRSP